MNKKAQMDESQKNTEYTKIKTAEYRNAFFSEKAKFAGSANPLIIFYILSFYLQIQRHLPTAQLYLHYLYDAD